MLTSTRRALAVLVAGTTAAALLAGAAPDRVRAAGTAAPAAPTAVAGRSVTLVTGDVVAVDAGGTPHVTPGGRTAGRSSPVAPGTGYDVYRKNGDWYVVPTGAARLVAAGLVDSALFDVTRLVADGYDDASTSTVPLLVQHTEVTATRAGTPLPGAKVRRELPTLGLTAEDEPKSGASAFWSALVGSAKPNGRAARSLGGGTRKIWLNARYRATLDRSVPQVGAPVAWRAGYTGAGVTVAVLDSGYDPTHPDLAGRVVDSEDFTGSGVTDRLGHGTHVASIVGGSGAASDGRRRGVAPGAQLAIGKVLDDSGGGQEDTVLAGMEWAVADAHAKVVNLSLGGGASDGTDPLDQAVDQLSAKYGALFVVAAGNQGAYAPVASPASADAALAVSSVDRSDVVSDFSSRGPRYGDGAAKPEIAAPGDAIEAARAAGAFPDIPGDRYYVPLSGTSMSSPHVAGAAAILAQRHPDWTGAQLKAALVDSAATANDSTVFDVGAGRLDVGRAVTQSVTAGAVTLSTDLAPGAGPTDLTQTYRNDGDGPVTLELALTMVVRSGAGSAPAPDGLAGPGVRTLTVPAHSTASVSVRVEPAGIASGSYEGVLQATAGGTSLRTPVAVQLEPRTSQLTVRDLDRTGTAVDSGPMIIGLDSDYANVVATGEPVTVPAGRYAVVDEIATAPAAGQDPVYSYVADPAVDVTGGTTVTLDARWATPVPLGVTDRPDASGGVRAVYLGAGVPGSVYHYDLVGLVDPALDPVYAGSAPGAHADEFEFTNVASLERPDLRLVADDSPVPARWLESRPGAPFVGTAAVPAVSVPASALPGSVPAGVAGKLAVVVADSGADGGGGSVDLTAAVTALKAAGARMVAVTAPYDWDGTPPVLPTMVTATGTGSDRFADRVRRGGLTATVTGRTISPYRYLLSFQQRGAIPRGLSLTATTAGLAAVPTSYHDPVDDWRTVYAAASLAGRWYGTVYTVAVPAPLHRTEYYTPGNWSVSVEDNVILNAERQVLPALKAGANPPLCWDGAVTGPALTGQNWSSTVPFASRHDDLLTVQLPLFGDAAGHTRAAYDGIRNGPTGSTALYRDGQLVGTVAKPGWAQFAVPAGPAGYRLTARATVDDPLWPVSTAVDSAWTFRSGRVAGTALLPLLAVRFNAPVDLRDAVRVGDTRPLSVSVDRQTGSTVAPVTALTAQASYDDGKTWQQVPVTGHGNGWHAAVPHTRSGYVSLRTHAADAAGNTVDETILRAYRVTA